MSQVVNKFIDETEKSLCQVSAEQRKIILLLDETNALCGSGSEATGNDDRYPNAEISCLVQLMKD